MPMINEYHNTFHSTYWKLYCGFSKAKCDILAEISLRFTLSLNNENDHFNTPSRKTQSSTTQISMQLVKHAVCYKHQCYVYTINIKFLMHGESCLYKLNISLHHTLYNSYITFLSIK